MEKFDQSAQIINTMLKTSFAAQNALEALIDLHKQLVPVFNAAESEINELELQLEKMQIRVTDLEAENKNLLTEIEDLRKQFETNSEPVEIPEPVVTKEETPEN